MAETDVLTGQNPDHYSMQLPPPEPQYPASAFMRLQVPPAEPDMGSVAGDLWGAATGFAGFTKRAFEDVIPFHMIKALGEGAFPTQEVSPGKQAYPLAQPQLYQMIEDFGKAVGWGPHQILEAQIIPGVVGEPLVRLFWMAQTGVGEFGREVADRVNLIAGKEVMNPVAAQETFGGMFEAETARRMGQAGEYAPRTVDVAKDVIGKVKGALAKRVAEAKPQEDITGRPLIVEVPAPPGDVVLHPLVVGAADRAALFDEAVKAFQETDTKSLSPQAIYDFAKSTAVRDEVISVPVDAVKRVYAERGATPTAGDDILGFVPDLPEQIRKAEDRGGNVTVPVASYLAHVTEDVHASLSDDLRISGAVSVNEATKLVGDAKDYVALKAEQAAEAAPVEPAVKPAEVAPTEAGIAPEVVKPVEAVQAKPVEPTAVQPVVETRGQGVQFHGTPDVNLALDEGHYTTKNFYGQGVYTTDAADIAVGYADRGVKKGKEPGVIYKIEPKPGLNILDMEQPVPGWLSAHITEQADRHPNSELDSYAATILEESKPATLHEFYDELRADSAGENISADSVQEIFEGLREVVEENGYQGLRHIGGKITGKTAHDVVIYFNPENVRAVKINRDELLKPVAEPTAAVPVEADLGDVVPEVEGPRVPLEGEVTEGDFTSRFSLTKTGGGAAGEQSYAVSRDNRVVGSVKVGLEPGDPTTVRIGDVQIADPADRPGMSDTRKLFREVKRDFPTATHARLGTGPKTKIPTPAEMIRKQLYIEPVITKEAAGMTAEEYRLYSDRAEGNLREFQAAVAAKEREIAGRNAKRAQRETTKAERAKAEAEFDARRDVSAETALLKAEVKFDEALVDKGTIPGGLTASEANGGLAPDDVAASMGYGSGAELLRDLEGLHQDRAGLGRIEYKKSVVDRKVKEVVPELADFTDEAFMPALSEVLYDDYRVMFMQVEGEASRPLSYEELVARAKRLFDEMTVKEATDLAAFRREVAKNGRQTELELLRGNKAEAFRLKLMQTQAHLMMHEAIQFSKEFAKPIGPALRAESRAAKEKAAEEKRIAEGNQMEEPPEQAVTVTKTPPRLSPTALLKRYMTKRSLSDLIDQDYVNQIQGILMKYQLISGEQALRVKAELERAGQGLDKFIEEKNAEGASIEVDDFVLNPWTDKKLEDLTVDEHRRLFDSIRSLDHAGRQAKLAYLEGEEKTLVEGENEVVETLGEKGLARDPNAGPLKKLLTKLGYTWDALNARMEVVLFDLDNRNPNGFLTRAVTQVLQKSKARENELFKWLEGEMGKLGQIDNAMLYLMDVPFIDRLTMGGRDRPEGYAFKIRRHEATLIAAQLGNETSSEAVVSTLMGRKKFEEDPVGATQFVRDWVEKTLTPNDWKFVEGLWGIFAQIKPMLDDLGRRTSGRAPDSTGTLSWNGHTGGHYPIIHDPRGGKIQSVRTKNQLLESLYRGATPTQKHMKQRTGQFMDVIIQDAFAHLPGAIRAQLHDVAFKEGLAQAQRVLTRPKILEAVGKHYGEEYTKQWMPWLREIANHYNQDDAMLGTIAQLMRGLRRNIVVSAISYNFNVLFSPNLIPGAISRLGYTPSEAARKLMGPGAAEWKSWVLANSPEIRFRMENAERDFRDALEQAVGTQSTLRWLQSEAGRFGMLLPVKIETELMLMTWEKAYTQAMTEGTTFFYRDKPQAFSHEAAVQAAEQTVRMFFGSQHVLDLPAIMRMSETSKLLGTMFLSFQNTMYHRTRDVVMLSADGTRRLRAGHYQGLNSTFSQAAAQAWAFIIIPAAFGYLYNKGAIDQELKKGNYGKAAGMLLGQQLLSTMPYVRDIGGLVMGYPTRPGPIGVIGEDLVRAYKDVFVKDVGKPSTIKDLAVLAGELIGVPGARQLGRTGQYLWNLHTGHDTDRYFSEWVNGIMYGKSKP